MSEKKIQVGYVFKFDCNNEVLRLKMTKEHKENDGEILSLPNASALARVSREIKPHPESMTTWYDLDFPAVVHNAFTMRMTEAEIQKMKGKLDIPATASEFSAEIIAASDKGDYKKVCSIWGSIGQSENVEIGNEILIEMHKNPAVVEVLVASALATQPSEEERVRDEIERLDAERRLWALGYDCYVDWATGFSYWAQGKDGLRYNQDYHHSDARKVLKSLIRA